ncbi:quinone oxidoreductase family protein [Micromonospora sp. LOL_023]|uniref:quinone oxidoreductase family protein n=1 Tax=Micromonospora sp. LOL_023 TaxID=3345418 RepID=UPI003A8605C3
MAMKAWRLHRSRADRLEFDDVPVPEPAAGEVLVEIHAIGLNSSEMQLVRGDWEGPDLKRPYPMIPGIEAAGVIVAAGPGAPTHRVGERVTVHYRWACGDCDECVGGNENTCQVAAAPDAPKFGRTIDGAYAEYARVPAGFAVRIPDQVSYADAAAMTVSGGTAWHMAVVRGQLRPNETVLVTGGSSGVGSMLVQIAKLAGTRVAATAGGPDKARRLRELGVELVLDHRADDDWSASFAQLSDGAGIDCVLDISGAGTWPRFMGSMRHHGRIIVGGYMSGDRGDFDLKESTIREIAIAGASSWTRRSVRDVLGLAAHGDLRPVVGATLPLRELPDGLRMLRDRTAYGNLVVQVR